ncbi:MAG TPA: SMP-30/gluconolactonase/LRE family protein [Solirubrobacteraceae bacterium]|jgi:sugar lactone lactonase YvrE|nr:SMP-30/gluconolactonase/LRE family protein [Solirubrobacteraceae bacterium]
MTPSRRIQVVAEDVAFGESPRWHDGRLWFADWGAREILTVDEAGTKELVLRVDFPAFPMCLDFLPDGRLLVVAGRDGRLLRREHDGRLVRHADLGALSRHPWNDIVVDGAGNAYVNNTGFEFPGEKFRPGTVALVTPDGGAREVAHGLAFPNGMAITPDGRTLIVAESYVGRLTAFDIGEDGDLSDRRIWAELPGSAPDGICLDEDGAAWFAEVPGKRCVRVAEGGEVLETIEHDRGCFACILGGADRRTLFFLAQSWGGVQASIAGAGGRTGQVLAVVAPAPSAGRP